MSEQPALWQSRIVAHGKANPRDLTAHPLNWRAHPENQRTALSGTIDDMGFWRSVSVNRPTGTIIDGHLRVALAIEQNQPEIDVEWVDLTEDEERKALATADSIAGLAEVNTEHLDALLRSIDYANPAVADFLAQFARENGLFLDAPEIPDDPGPRVEQAEQLRDQWQTEPGQLWIIPSRTVPGKEHRLLVGDSTEPLIVSQLMASDVGRDNWLTDLFEQADMVFTDPPYGVEYVGKTKDQLVIQNDRLGDAGTRMLIGDMARAWPLKPGGAYYLCAPAGNLITTFALGLADAEMEIRQSLVWVKHHFVMGRQDYHWRHESILYGWMEGAAHYFVDDRTQDTVIDDTPDPKTLSKAELIDLVHFLRRAQKDSVWYEDRPSASTLHPTIKPTDLVAKGIQNSSRPGELVFDGFVGSGTTIAACEQTRRICRALEIEPKFAAVTLQRCAEMQMHPELVRVYGRA